MRKNAEAADSLTKLAKKKEDHYENDNTQTAETSLLHKRFFWSAVLIYIVFVWTINYWNQ